MRKNTADFSQTSIDTVRAQAAQIPAVVFANNKNNSPELIKDILAQFFTNPNPTTYNAVKDIYVLYSVTAAVSRNDFMVMLNAKYASVLMSLNSGLADRIFNDSIGQTAVTVLARDTTSTLVAPLK
jgi:hypothetical protein